MDAAFRLSKCRSCNKPVSLLTLVFRGSTANFFLLITEKIVPFMGIAYVLISLIIIFAHIPNIPGAFASIFRDAFDFRAILGGLSGSCMVYGIKRGLYSNEAGVGSAPNASASAEVNHPVKQGLVQILSVFIDTLLICSATAFMCMSSGVKPTAELSGAPYVQAALSQTLGQFGPIFITVAMLLFAFTTLLGNLYYVDQCAVFFLGRVPSKKVQNIYHIIAAIVIFVGAIVGIEVAIIFALLKMLYWYIFTTLRYIFQHLLLAL